MPRSHTREGTRVILVIKGEAWQEGTRVILVNKGEARQFQIHTNIHAIETGM